MPIHDLLATNDEEEVSTAAVINESITQLREVTFLRLLAGRQRGIMTVSWFIVNLLRSDTYELNCCSDQKSAKFLFLYLISYYIINF